MTRLSRLPGWLLVAVWVMVPVLAVALVAVSLTGDDDAEPSAREVLGIGSAEVDVQTAELQRQRRAAGIVDCPAPAGAASSRPAPPDSGLPAISLPCLGDDVSVDLSALRGPLVLNLWAQSCGPCRDEMPLLQRLHEATDKVTVLGVDFQDLQPGMALALAEATGTTYPSVADVDGELKAPLRLTGLPTTLFIDADGEVVGTERRAFSSYADVVAVVEDKLRLRL
ncbi:MAG TPA: TlpA disulfide reductase family protein [Nocardioidaceae bacterium]|nr:TlpA disulfide reductase family protein [Nocardioidaceae bacterium]